MELTIRAHWNGQPISADKFGPDPQAFIPSEYWWLNIGDGSADFGISIDDDRRVEFVRAVAQALGLTCEGIVELGASPELSEAEGVTNG